MQLAIDWRKLSPEERFRHAFKLGYVFFLGYWTGEEINEGRLAFDGKRWVTMHPGGKGPKADGSGNKKGRHVQIESTTGEILKGPFKGQKITEIGKRSASSLATSEASTRVPNATMPTSEIQHAIKSPRDTSVTQCPNWIPENARFQGNTHHPAVQRVWQPMAANPLPSDFSSAKEAVDWYSRALPFLEAEGIKHIAPKHAHGIAKGACAMLWVFPFLAQKKVGLSGITNEAQAQEELARYQAEFDRQTHKIKSNIKVLRRIYLDAKQTVNNCITSVDPTHWSAAWFGQKLKLDREQVASILPETKAKYDNMKPADQSTLQRALQMEVVNTVVRSFAQKACSDLGIYEPEIVTEYEPPAGAGPYVAYFMPKDRKFWTCKAFFGAKAKSDFDQSNYDKTGFHPAAGPEWTNSALVAVHELAHSLDLAFGDGVAFSSCSDPKIKHLYNLFIEKEEHREKQLAIAGMYVKPYAAESKQEFFAEKITEALTSDKPSAIALEVFSRALQLQEDRLT